MNKYLTLLIALSIITAILSLLMINNPAPSKRKVHIYHVSNGAIHEIDSLPRGRWINPMAFHYEKENLTIIIVKD